jgi:type IV pilus assembly protein PilW
MKRQTGLSLVELMIAVTLGLVLSSAAISAFISVKKVNNTTSGSAGLADSGRFAFEQLGMGLKSAGYMGCSTSSEARVDLSTTLPVLVTDLGEPLGGYEYTGTGIGGNFALVTPYVKAGGAGNWVASATLGGLLDPGIFSAAVSGGAVGNPIAGSDVIAMHESPVGTTPLYLTGTASVGAGNVSTTLATAGPNAGFANVIAAGGSPIAAVANCQSAEVFSVSSIAGAVLNISTTNAQQHLVTAYGAGSHVTLVDTRVYYIGVGSDGEGALFVLDTNGSTAFANPVELVSDVENMQVLYGVDTTGSKSVTQYVTADQVPLIASTGDFNSVINVQIGLLLSGPPGSGPAATAPQPYTVLGTTITAPADSRLRSVFTATLTLRDDTG